MNKNISQKMIYMFCLYHFSLKCIIKKIYLPPYDPLKIYCYIMPVFSEDLYSSWRWWARLLLHCLRGDAGNSSRTSRRVVRDSFYCIYVFSCNIKEIQAQIFLQNVFKKSCRECFFMHLLLLCFL